MQREPVIPWRNVQRSAAGEQIVRKGIKEGHSTMTGQEVKHHPAILHDEIVELEPDPGYGFARADDEKWVYFRKDGRVTGTWEDLSQGARLRFREQDGENGPFAVDVAPAP